MKLRKFSDYKSMAWKNGGGITSEIAIWPESVDFADGDFLWRLSSAKISAKNKFSEFVGYDRVLFVIKGQGLLLESYKLEPLKAFVFKGEIPMQCEPLSDEVIDLGIIFKRGQVKVYTEILKFNLEQTTKEEFSSELSIEGELTFLFCVHGRCTVQRMAHDIDDPAKVATAQMLVTMETLEIKKSRKLEIKILEPSTLILIGITEI